MGAIRAMIPRALLQETARSWTIELTDRQLDQFDRYADELVSWNVHTNLTAITEPRAITTRHFLDSLSIVPFVPSPPESIADIGTGAGFPGIPLKIIWPQARLLLVESIGKKTSFLAHIASALDLQHVEVSTARAEQIGQDSRYRERFDLVTGRAVAELNILAEYCLPLCRVGGLFVAPKSDAAEPEAESARAALQELGGEIHCIERVDIPDVGPRSLIVVRKTTPTPARYPRRTGIPQKRPL